jgi:hypothetical protein
MERVFVEVKAEFLILAAGGFTEGKRTLDPLMPSLALDGNRTSIPKNRPHHHHYNQPALSVIAVRGLVRYING